MCEMTSLQQSVAPPKISVKNFNSFPTSEAHLYAQFQIVLKIQPVFDTAILENVAWRSKSLVLNYATLARISNHHRTHILVLMVKVMILKLLCTNFQLQTLSSNFPSLWPPLRIWKYYTYWSGLQKEETSKNFTFELCKFSIFVQQIVNFGSLFSN